MVRGAFRQARPLAEGQKTRMLWTFCLSHPPSARQLELAERVKSPEKNGVFFRFADHLAEGVSGWTPARLAGILNHV
jgi:hypothetical protein